MPHAHNATDLSAYAALLDQEERRYMRYRYQRVKKCKEITDRIEASQNEDEKDIMLMKWDRISEKMGFSLQHIHKIHAQALKNFKMR